MTVESFDAVDEGGTDRTRVILFGALGAAVLAAGGYFLLAGGGDEADTALVIPKAKKPVTAVKPAAAKPAAKPAQLPAATTVRLGRDPFLALYTEPKDVPAATTPVTPTDTVVPAAGSGTTTDKPVSTTYALRLTRVYGEGKDLTGVFSAAGKTQTAKVGSVFGRSSELKLLSLQQGAKGAWTAVVQVGDSEPFDAATGQTYYVL